MEAILDAVVLVLKRDGLRAITTNRIAQVAGVSIGSIYQYFPDKQAMFVALHQRHIEQVDRMVQTKLVQHATSSLEELIRAMIDGMIDAHTADPELHDLLFTEVPYRADGTRAFADRMHGAFRLAISSRAHELKHDRNLDIIAFVVTHMVESLSHGLSFRRPPNVSFADAKEEVVRAVLAYVRSRGATSESNVTGNPETLTR